ncbi:hypothetical protein GALMADRAFT_147344 [Galerina marginata CBS 339.88]|uniref:Uncharacterized protein n=1 Tax=Galerina marginata (strain CBS 339.88) TaxID=685588 RepID=A0A067S8C2_GALM3|nr:hypothetical protein GALMADRAFT_147344 [Galerina marginata CBS 339.88]
MDTATADPGRDTSTKEASPRTKGSQSTPASIINTSSSTARSRGRSFSSITDDDDDLSILAQYARPSIFLHTFTSSSPRGGGPPMKLSQWVVPTPASLVVEPKEADDVGAIGRKALGDGVGQAEAEEVEAEGNWTTAGRSSTGGERREIASGPGNEEVDVDDGDGGADGEVEADREGVTGLPVLTSASIARWSGSDVPATTSTSLSHFHSHSPSRRGSFSSVNDDGKDGLLKQQDHPRPRSPPLSPVHACCYAVVHCL